MTKGHAIMTMMVLLWASALLSSVLDNIPFVATLIPLVLALGESGTDLRKFQSAYNSSNFTKFIDVAGSLATFDKEIENLFMTHNVDRENLEKIEAEMQKLHTLIAEITAVSPILT